MYACVHVCMCNACVITVCNLVILYYTILWVMISENVENILTTGLHTLHNWKCYINVVTRTCSEFYWYIWTLPWALSILGNCAYRSVKPSLPCYNILLYACMYVCMHMCVYIYIPLKPYFKDFYSVIYLISGSPLHTR